MSNDKELEIVVNNEKEWRKYMIKRLDKLDQDFNIFKLKSFGFLTVLSAIMNFLMKHYDK